MLVVGKTILTKSRKVRDHDHLTGKYREAACNKCTLICFQEEPNFVPVFFHNFCGYDCHFLFEDFLQTNAKPINEKDFFKLLNNAFFGKTMENIRDRVNLEFISHRQIQRKKIDNLK